MNEYDIQRCRLCATLFTATLPANLRYDYDEYYDDATLAAPDAVRRSLQRTIASFARCKVSGRLLDVGFGGAIALQEAKRAGWDVSGVEVSGLAVERARRLGLPAFHGTLAEAAFPAASFDVVMAVEVLEHVPDVGELIGDMARVLRPGGLLWLTTPNARGLSARLLGTRWSVLCPPEHLQLLSPKGLRLVLDAAGLRPVRVRTSGVNPHELLAAARGRCIEGAQRVESAYDLLVAADRQPALRLAKFGVNGVLAALGIGDSLRVWAERAS